MNSETTLFKFIGRGDSLQIGWFRIYATFDYSKSVREISVMHLMGRLPNKYFEYSPEGLDNALNYATEGSKNV